MALRPDPYCRTCFDGGVALFRAIRDASGRAYGRFLFKTDGCPDCGRTLAKELERADALR